MKNRQGSYTVFVMIFFSTLLILVTAVVRASASAGISSTVNHFGRLWGTSILAEYDQVLQQRYCLYGFHGEGSLTAEKLDLLADYSFGEKNYITYDGSVCRLDEYALTQPEILKGQMMEAVLMQNKPHPLRSAAAENERKETVSADRQITSRWILENLPSYGRKEDADVSEAVSRIKEGFSLETIASQSAVNQYIITCFRHCRSGTELGDTYFTNEIEYILTGYADDARARKKVKQKLVLLRNLLNLSYLYASPEKRDAAMVMAAALTPGPEAVLTQAALLELWAYAEAENDIALLYEDEKVPLLKSDRTWALTLENAMEAGEGAVRPEVMEGYAYESYLRILLSLISEETRLLRAMDLIQINMKYLYSGTFRLKDYYAGLAFTLHVNGKDYEFEECYDRTKPEGQLSG